MDSAMATIERDVGALEARMETVEQEIHAMRSDVREIRDALVSTRGGWKLLTLIVGISASVGAALAKLVPIFSTPRV